MRALTLRGRLSRLYAIVDAAERRAAQRQNQVQDLRASARLLCQRSIQVGRGSVDQPGPERRTTP
ncbi:MAG TPA: hypothetical protein VGL23_12065 [Chloroflexota bacterium]